MGSCLCLRKSELIVEDEAAVTTTTFEPTPYKWAVINPRPSLTRLLLRQQQHQGKQLAQEGVLSVEISPQSTVYPLGPTPIPESHSLTCLEVLEGCSRDPDYLDYSLSCDQQKQELINTEVRSGRISPQMVGSPVCSISSPQRGGENERSSLEDQLSSSTFSHGFKSESTFSHITAEFGESDESSLYGSPQKPLLQEIGHYQRARSPMQAEPRRRIFSPKYGIRCSKRLPKKLWASEQEMLLQKSPMFQQRQSFQ